MNKTMKILLAVVVIVVLAVIAGILFIGNMDVTLEGNGAEVTLPNTYELDASAKIATKDNIEIFFIGIIDGPQSETDFFKAVQANGNSSGYANVSEDSINGFKVYEYAATTADLKTVKYGTSTQWTEYPPYNLTDSTGSKIDSHHYRVVDYVSPNNSTLNQLYIVAKDENTDLYSSEISDIIHSIKTVEN